VFETHIFVVRTTNTMDSETLLVAIFCDCHDFTKSFEPAFQTHLLSKGNHRNRAATMHLCEIMTIWIMFHHSGYKNFKHFYTQWVSLYHRKDFTHVVSYARFISLSKKAMIPLFFFLQKRMGLAQRTGIQFIDSTKMEVCHNLRIYRHRVFRSVARRGKTSTGWFYGFKLHLIINEKGELLSYTLSSGNTDDRNPKVLKQLTKGLWGKIFGDRGYISQQIEQQMAETGIEWITKVRKNMKSKYRKLTDKILLKKRGLIETVIDELKTQMTIQHTRHRSLDGWALNTLSALTAYTYLPKKPSLHIPPHELQLLHPLPLPA